MSKTFFKMNTRVCWKWLGRQIQGQVVEVYNQPVTKTIKGKSIKRNGSKECPAYLVQAESGNLALKLHTELFVCKTDDIKKSKPKIFSK